ncbi:MAG: (2Fe-2S)-binding protein [Rhodococcus sp. (in: high G+C Gram-positive bacteria)]
MVAESALTDAASVVAQTSRSLPWMAEMMAIDPGHGYRLLDSETMDGGLLDAALERAARRWPDVSAATCATLWWYGSSSTVAIVTAAQLLVTGRCVDPRSPRTLVTVGDTGTIGAVTSSTVVDAADAPDALADLVETVVRALCRRVPELNAGSLWAVASDSIANRTLDVATAVDRIADAATMSASLTSRARTRRFPTPRFVDVGTEGAVAAASDDAPVRHTRRFLRRSSCCLVFEAGEDMCVSCPRRTPADRARRWSTLVG